MQNDGEHRLASRGKRNRVNVYLHTSVILSEEESLGGEDLNTGLHQSTTQPEKSTLCSSAWPFRK